MKKFKESVLLEKGKYSVFTDDGWQDVTAIHKTIPYKVYEIKTINFQLKCADNHIVFGKDLNSNLSEVFVKDLKLNDFIWTRLGFQTIISIEILDYEEEMYDLQLIRTSKKRYYTNEILSHNTSLATILSQGLPTIKINASSARGIDTVRDVIVPHCSTLSFTQSVDENLKLVFLDEFDNATRDFYDAMRGTIEQYSDNARFIATCNYSNKITPEVRDRFLELNFSPQNKEEEVELFNKYKDRITKLSPRINIEWESDEVLDKFISNMFPSFRKMISSLQSFMDSGTTLVTNSDVNRATYSFIDLYKMIVSKSDPYKIYQFIMTDYQNKVDEVLESLGSEFPKWVKENEPSKSSLIGAACIYSAEWQWKKTMLVDPVQALNACIFQINSIFSK